MKAQPLVQQRSDQFRLLIEAVKDYAIFLVVPREVV